MASLFGAFPFLIKLYADGGYQGPEFQSAMKRILARVTVEIVEHRRDNDINGLQRTGETDEDRRGDRPVSMISMGCEGPTRTDEPLRRTSLEGIIKVPH
jgi:hypothetical protein